jgi:hypothetical protein
MYQSAIKEGGIIIWHGFEGHDASKHLSSELTLHSNNEHKCCDTQVRHINDTRTSFSLKLNY